MTDGCRNCGAQTSWGTYFDEDGCECSEPEEYCGYCYDVMAEREQKRREWAEYHPGDHCPEIELPQFSKS